MEDAVQENLKEQARDNLDAFLSETPDARILVRLNAPDHWAHVADLDLCRRHAGVIGMLLPKTESTKQVTTAALGPAKVCFGSRLCENANDCLTF